MNSTTLSPEQLIHLYEQMLLIRRFEEKCAEMYTLQKITGFCHLYIGQEAIAVGAMSAIRPDDYILTAYRDHGHALAKGSDPKLVMAELFGKYTGLCKGKGGSMHLFDIEHNMLGGYAIVAGHLPIATGVAFAIKYLKKDQVVLCFFGEGAVNAGVFHESLNLAELWKLPIVYICENNRYGMGTPVERASSIYNIAQKACAYEMRREHIDGMNVLEVREHVLQAVELARTKQLPSFIEMKTFRFMGHSMSDPAHGHYRTKEELEEQKKLDPIVSFQNRLVEQNILNQAKIEQIEQQVAQQVEEAVEFAEHSPFPPIESVATDVYI
ncbi:MAG: pyruvate dehydrogenase (acetyl-transferring) E1 component subunit alpha [bacterium]|nr:pyruvate dehydrogenase (acetyl-transferring) E1 component subunit alpha [bacterium]